MQLTRMSKLNGYVTLEFTFLEIFRNFDHEIKQFSELKWIFAIKHETKALDNETLLKTISTTQQ